MLMLHMYRDSFIPYHNAPGTKIGRPSVHKAYIDYCKAKSMFYMMESFLCIVIMEHGILGQVWYLIVSIPDLCTLTYFVEELVF